jgi:hypothetical protein
MTLKSTLMIPYYFNMDSGITDELKVVPGSHGSTNTILIVGLITI